jgi:hypothetical protein
MPRRWAETKLVWCDGSYNKDRSVSAVEAEARMEVSCGTFKTTRRRSPSLGLSKLH